MKRTRKFNGKVYKLYALTFTKKQANKAQEKMINFGHLARITKTKDGYSVWWRAAY